MINELSEIMHKQKILSIEMDGLKIVLGAFKEEPSPQGEGIDENVKESDDFYKLQEMVSNIDNGVIYGKTE